MIDQHLALIDRHSRGAAKRILVVAEDLIAPHVDDATWALFRKSVLDALGDLSATGQFLITAAVEGMTVNELAIRGHLDARDPVYLERDGCRR